MPIKPSKPFVKPSERRRPSKGVSLFDEDVPHQKSKESVHESKEASVEEAWTTAFYAVSTPLRFMPSHREVQELKTMGTLKEPLETAFVQRFASHVQTLTQFIEEERKRLEQWERDHPPEANGGTKTTFESPIEAIISRSDAVNTSVQEALRAGLFESVVQTLGAADWNQFAFYVVLRSVFQSLHEGDGLSRKDKSEQSVARLQWLVNDEQAKPFWAAWGQAERHPPGFQNLETFVLRDHQDCRSLGHWVGELITKMTQDERWIVAGVQCLGLMAQALHQEPKSASKGPVLKALKRIEGSHATSAIKYGYPRFTEKHGPIFKALPLSFWVRVIGSVEFSSRTGQWVVQQVLSNTPLDTPEPLIQLAVVAWKNLDKKGLLTLEEARPGVPEQALSHITAQTLNLLPNADRHPRSRWTSKTFERWGADSNDLSAWAVKNQDKALQALQELNASLQRATLKKHLRQSQAVNTSLAHSEGPVPLANPIEESDAIQASPPEKTSRTRKSTPAKRKGMRL